MIESSSRDYQPQIHEQHNQLQVMLVDDDAVFRNMMRGFLTSCGYKVLEASNGLEGLQQLRDQVPDLVISDLSMPILDGIEFVEEVCWEYPSLPMIVVSATENMSDVAKALRFGIKDFLTKPIGDLNHLKSAIENTLSDADQENADQRDFASQWFGVDENVALPEEQELHWHLGYLQQNPNMARQLLEALLPERDTEQGGWKCGYRLLQSSEGQPLVFDYAWVMDGQFAFYIVDASSGEETSVATTLLIRALFNDYLRSHGHEHVDLAGMVKTITQGIQCSDYAGSINALFGIADMTDESVCFAPAGLEATWSNGMTTTKLVSTIALGELARTEVITLGMTGGGQLNFNKVGSLSFSLDITQNQFQ
ncbi:response regulator [Vibrio sp. SCSIO 43136]|uniref:response regulator n=1 Tax=Vibrio sp. SCSIO 43136 TaxID=2819101 RepID=UPI00207595F0|nr:response regulator [Vibrio sp. SCSIO 43136]USD66036.1 response regulator [Vibrio sp. SCSIO 43136]